MAKISRLTGDIETPGEEYYIFECPGCECAHMVRVYPGHPEKGWTYNGDENNPTISPSILVNAGLETPDTPRCHSFVKNGKIEFLGDCTHELAGQTVELKDI